MATFTEKSALSRKKNVSFFETVQFVSILNVSVCISDCTCNLINVQLSYNVKTE